MGLGFMSDAGKDTEVTDPWSPSPVGPQSKAQHTFLSEHLF